MKANHTSKNQIKPFNERLSNSLYSIGQIICIIVLAALSGIALLYSANFGILSGENYAEAPLFAYATNADGLSQIAASVLGAAILLCLLFVVWKCKPGKCKPKVLLACVCAWVFIAQLIWVFSLNTQAYSFNDTISLSVAAQELLNGNLSAFSTGVESEGVFSPNFYFTLYPYQAGSMYLFVLIFALFGHENYIAFQIVNALANVVVVLCLFWIVKSYTNKVRTQNLCLVLCAVCTPLLMSCALIYGNTAGLMFSALALALLTHGLKQQSTKKKLIFVALSFVAIALAMVVKNTCIIFLIAMAILLIVEAIKNKSASLFVVTLVCALLAQQAGGLPTKVLEAQTGANFGSGMPKTSWIAMGLRSDNPLETPGWWSMHAYNIYEECNGDSKAQSSMALSEIKDSIANFVVHPREGFNFFKTKLASEWAMPLYQTDYYSSSAMTGQNNEREYGSVAWDVLYRNSTWPMRLFADSYQLVVYFGALAFAVMAWRMRKKKKAPSRCVLTLLPASIVLGFLVYALWEAKSIYTLPFFVLMLPLAAVALNKLYEWFNGRMYYSNKKTE